MITRTVKCPTCGHDMQSRERHGVTLDLCPHCRGVWLDRGELDSIIERSARYLEIPDEDEMLKHRPHHRAQERYDRFDWF